MMPIDRLFARACDIFWHYLDIAVEAPTHFTRSHWIVLSVLAVTFGVLCMRGFGSRKNY
jgi:hypothetical protein